MPESNPNKIGGFLNRPRTNYDRSQRPDPAIHDLKGGRRAVLFVLVALLRKYAPCAKIIVWGSEMKPSDSTRGKAWLRNFEEHEQFAARVLLDSVDLVSQDRLR